MLKLDLRSYKFLPFIFVLIFLLVSACGTNTASTGEQASQPANAAANQTEASSSTEQASTSESGAPAARSIKHAMGTLEMKDVPLNIVALEWVYAEDLLALGIQPAGVADVKGYSAYLNVKPELAADVTDVGTRQEPNLETIASLKPDLIIGADFRHKAIYEKLTAIAPTLLYSPYPEEGGVNQYEEMELTFLSIADAVNKQDEAQAVLKGLNDAYAAAGEKLKAAGKHGSEFVLTQAWSDQNAPVLRLFTDNSLAVQVSNKIGLTNAHKSEKFEVYGFSTATVEALPALEKAHFLYIAQDDDNVFENQLKENPIWQSLSFVKENRTYSLGGDTWPFGGPLSAQVLVDKFTEELTK